MGAYFIKDDYVHRTRAETVVDDDAAYWDPARRERSRHFQRAVYDEALALVRRRGLRTVLDVGCGFPLKLMEVLAPHAEVTGVDLPEVVEVAQKHFPGGRFVGVDLEAPGEALAERFDLVMCSDVIEHLLSPDALIDFLIARCHARSWIVISTPERDLLRGVANAKSPQPEHVREWNQRELRAYLEHRGIVVHRHVVVPGFSIGRSPRMLSDWARLTIRGRTRRYCQLVVGRPPHYASSRHG